MGCFLHPIGALHKKYKDALKLTTTYGEKFITDHLEPDGMIRTNINPIVSTGSGILVDGPKYAARSPVRDPVGNRSHQLFPCTGRAMSFA